MNVLPEPPDVPPPPEPPGEPLVVETSAVEGPPGDEPLPPELPEPPEVEEPEIRDGPPGEPPCEPEIEVSKTEGPPEGRVRFSRTSTHRRWLGQPGRVFRSDRGFVQRAFSKRVSAIGQHSFEAGASRHRGGNELYQQEPSRARVGAGPRATATPRAGTRPLARRIGIPSPSGQ